MALARWALILGIIGVLDGLLSPAVFEHVLLYDILLLAMLGAGILAVALGAPALRRAGADKRQRRTAITAIVLGAIVLFFLLPIHGCAVSSFG